MLSFYNLVQMSIRLSSSHDLYQTRIEFREKSRKTITESNKICSQQTIKTERIILKKNLYICVLIICFKVIQTRISDTPTRNEDQLWTSSNVTNSFYFKRNQFSYFKILFRSEVCHRWNQ